MFLLFFFVELFLKFCLVVILFDVLNICLEYMFKGIMIIIYFIDLYLVYKIFDIE